MPNKQTEVTAKEISSTLWKRQMDLIATISLMAIAFFIYLSTMSRSMPYIDGGEITTVLWTLGIAHPTGYPLFTLLGYAFIHIPFFYEVVQRANFFAVVCTSIAGGIFYLVFLKAQLILTSSETIGLNKKTGQSIAKNNSKVKRLPDAFTIRVASIIAVSSLMFSKTFWTQSTVVESYPLQLLLFATIFLSWFKLYSAPTNSNAFMAGLTLGLGFTNHMTTVLTLPALMFLLILAYKKSFVKVKGTDEKSRFGRLGLIIFGAALAGLLYLYLPLRSSQHPLMDWGNPDNLQRFIRHVTAKQFRTWMFSSFDVFQHQLGVFYSSLFTEFRITILIVILGLIVSMFSYKKYFWWTAILFASDLLYAANYNIHNIESYFLLAYISLALFSANGFRFILDHLLNLPHGKIITATLLLFPALSVFANFGEVNASQDYAVQMYTRDILTSPPENSLVLSYQWDTFVASSLYYQNVDKLRPDIIVIDKELLRRSWYVAQVHERYAFIFPKDDPVYQDYQDNLRLFENDLPYDPNIIERSYAGFIREIILGAMKDGRDVFVAPEIEDQYLFGFNKVPCGLLFELRTDTSYISFDKKKLDGFRAAEKVDNDYSHQIISFYSRMFQTRAAYEYSHHNLEMTSFWLDQTLDVDPSSSAVQAAKLQVLRQMSRVALDSSSHQGRRLGTHSGKGD